MFVKAGGFGSFEVIDHDLNTRVRAFVSFRQPAVPPKNFVQSRVKWEAGEVF